MSWKKVLGGLAIAIVAGGGGLLGFLELRSPAARPLTDRRFESTPARVERGAYLAKHVYGCVDCHGERDWKAPGAPMKEGRAGVGVVWSDEGMPWLVAPNLTSDPETGIGQVSDDGLARAVREGVGRDGRALFPIMPYVAYRRMPDEDLASVIAYLRSLPPVKNPLPRTAVPFPLRLLIKGLPQPISGAVPAPDLATPEKRGEFLVRTTDCAGCHTPKQRGEAVPGLDLAGGFALESPLGRVVSSNLTPDPSGIPYYDQALFLEMMRSGKVKGREVSPVMPWVFFGGMTDEDLKAIFAYLKTLPPVVHRVDNIDTPTSCRRCGERHGLGDRN